MKQTPRPVTLLSNGPDIIEARGPDGTLVALIRTERGGGLISRYRVVLPGEDAEAVFQVFGGGPQKARAEAIRWVRRRGAP